MEQYLGNQGTFSSWHVANSTTSKDPSAPPSLAREGLWIKAKVETREGARDTESPRATTEGTAPPRAGNLRSWEKQEYKPRNKTAIKEKGRNN